MTLPRKAVIAITGYSGEFGPNSKSGLWFSEALHPFEVLKKNGFEVVMASENGKFGIDPKSLSPDSNTAEDLKQYNNPASNINIALKNVKKASDLNAKEFGLFYAAGGHAALFDFPTARTLQLIAEDIYQRGGVVAAVCHGPVILPGIKDLKTGESIVKGKKVTGFTELEEQQVGASEALKTTGLKIVKDYLEQVGGTFVAPESPFVDYSIIDGRVVTGTNPQSATSTAEKAVKVFQEVV